MTYFRNLRLWLCEGRTAGASAVLSGPGPSPLEMPPEPKSSSLELLLVPLWVDDHPDCKVVVG